MLVSHSWMKFPHRLSDNVTHPQPHCTRCRGCAGDSGYCGKDCLRSHCHTANCWFLESMTLVAGVPGPTAGLVQLWPVYSFTLARVVSFSVNCCDFPGARYGGMGVPESAGEAAGLWLWWLHSANHEGSRRQRLGYVGLLSLHLKQHNLGQRGECSATQQGAQVLAAMKAGVAGSVAEVAQTK